ncbi:MAG TPA: transcriptional regulator, partial [Chitinophagaceae bacterium]|nr:transcriptional regulator [Chitinophagaceae bacterium]
MRLLLLILCFPLYASGQNTITLPEILNYSKQTYNAGTQNWGIHQDSRGLLYVANNEGMLRYDGAFWSIYPLPNRTNVRSVYVANDQQIFVGGQDELG